MTRPAGRRTRLLVAVAATTLLVGACRPPIGEGGEQDGSGGAPTVYPTDTPPPAFALKPETETNVQVRLFRGQGPADAALQYAQALDSYREVNLLVDIAPPIVGYDVFEVDPAAGIVTAWIGTLADVVAAPADLDLVAAGELVGLDPTVLVRPAAAADEPIGNLASPVVAETAGAAASLQAALAEAEAGSSTAQEILLLEDPAAPFDPSPLLAGTAPAGAASLYDGWARTQEALAAAGEDPASFAAAALRPEGQELLGELIWVLRKDFEDSAGRAAINAFVGVVVQSQIACRDALEDCAGTVAAQSDRTPDGIVWSLDQLNRLLFPAPDGIVHVDPAAWDRTVAAMRAGGLAGLERLTFTNDVVDTVSAAFGDRLDLTGATWTPPPEVPLIPPGTP